MKKDFFTYLISNESTEINSLYKEINSKKKKIIIQKHLYKKKSCMEIVLELILL